MFYNSYTTQQHYQPDYHNTHLAFDYVVAPHPTKRNSFACLPVPSQNEYVDQQKAQSTIDLLKLDAVTSNARATDLRWKYRYEAYFSAQLWRDSWDKFGKDCPDDFVPLLLDNIKGKGFFSIWYKTFEDNENIRKELLHVFRGTYKDAFDLQGRPIPLHAGDL